MILELLQRLYHTCKETLISIINALKALARVIIDASYLAGKIAIHTLVEGSLQLIKLSLYYPLKITVKTLIEGSVQLLKISIYYPLLLIFTQLKKVFQKVFSLVRSFWLIIFSISNTTARIIAKVTINTILFGYDYLIKKPTHLLSKTTTFIAQKIAVCVRIVRIINIKTARSIRLVGFALFSIIKQVIVRVILLPVKLIQNLVSTAMRVGMYLRALQASITHYFTFLLKNIYTTTHNQVTSTSTTILESGKFVVSSAACGAISFFTISKQQAKRLKNIFNQSALLIAQKIVGLRDSIINFITQSTTALIAKTNYGFIKALNLLQSITGSMYDAIVSTLSTCANLITHSKATVNRLINNIFRAVTNSSQRAARYTKNIAAQIGSVGLSLVYNVSHTSFQLFNQARQGYFKSIETLINTRNTITKFVMTTALQIKEIFVKHISAVSTVSRTIKEEVSNNSAKLQHATRVALAGTAGFVFFSIPRSTINAIKASYLSLQNKMSSATLWLYAFVQEIIQIWVFDLPAALLSGLKQLINHANTVISNLTTTLQSLFISLTDSIKSYSSSIVSKSTTILSEIKNETKALFEQASSHLYTAKWHTSKTQTQLKQLMLSGASILSIALKKVKQNATLSSIRIIQKVHEVSSTAINLLTKTNILIFKGAAHIANQTASTSRGGLNLLKKFYALGNALIIKTYNASIFALSWLANLLYSGAQELIKNLKMLCSSFFSHSKKATLIAGAAGKAGFLFLGKSSQYTLAGVWWSLKQVFSIPIYFFNHLKAFAKQTFALVKNVCLHILNGVIVLIIKAKQEALAIQQYALIGIFLYTVLVLVTTYITPPSDQKNFNQIGIEQYKAFPRALPIKTCFELQNISHSKGTFGSVAIKGILNYSYEAGLEAAKNIDNISVEKAESFTIKKLSSHINHRHIVTTRFLITATLGIQASTSAALPFAPTESTLVIKNNALTTHEAFYLPVASSFGTEFPMQHPTKIHMKQNTASPTETKSPKIIITLEHTGVPAYMLLTLYVLILCMTFMALMSLGVLLPQTIRLAVSGVATTGLSIMWILSHLFGLLPTINHLFLTLLMCLAISLVCVGFNAKYVTQKETKPETGKTRWTLGLLLLLAVFFTLLIGL